MKYVTAILVSCVLWTGAAQGAQFMRGDANQDGAVDISDPVRILLELFTKEFPQTTCQDAEDFNDDGKVDLSDAVFGLSYLFIDGADPNQPLSACGEDPTDDSLDCVSHTQCPVSPTPRLIRDASGWPDTTLTEGRPGMTSARQYPIGSTWGVTGVWLTLTERTVITGISGIGLTNEGTTPADDFRPRLNVHSSADAFAAAALHGDVHNDDAVRLAEEPILISKSGREFSWVYYVSFTFTPFELDAGTYVVSLYADRISTYWEWCESSREGGSDILTTSTTIGEWFEWTSLSEFGMTTGTAGVDIVGYASP